MYRLLPIILLIVFGCSRPEKPQLTPQDDEYWLEAGYKLVDCEECGGTGKIIYWERDGEKQDWLTYPSEWTVWLDEHQKNCDKGCISGLLLCDEAKEKKKELVSVSDDEVLELYCEHCKDMEKLWAAMPDDVSMTDVVVEWVARDGKMDNLNVKPIEYECPMCCGDGKLWSRKL